MITNNRSTTFSWWRKLLALPMVMLVAALFSFSLVKAQTDSSKIADEKSATKKKFDEKAAYEKLSPEQKEALQKKRSAENLKRATIIINNPPPGLYLLNGTVATPDAVRQLDPATVKRMSIKTNNREKQSFENFLNSAEGREMIMKYGDIVKQGVIEIYTDK
jgi:hypothetical protein